MWIKMINTSNITNPLVVTGEYVFHSILISIELFKISFEKKKKLLGKSTPFKLVLPQRVLTPFPEIALLNNRYVSVRITHLTCLFSSTISTKETPTSSVEILLGLRCALHRYQHCYHLPVSKHWFFCVCTNHNVGTMM